MKSLKKALIIALAVIMCISVVSCSDDETTTGTTQKTSETSEENGYQKVEGLDFGGKDFTILVPASVGWSQYNDFTATEITSEPVNDANYKRLQKIKELYNVNIVNKVADSSVVDDARSDILANLNSYDMILAEMCENGGVSALAEDGLLVDLASLENMHLDQPYYAQNAVENLSILGKLYFTTGDISTVDNDGISALSFNKKLVADEGLTDPYQLVRDGKWTLSSFYDICKGFYKDLNGNGEIDDEDRFGYLTDNENSLFLMIGGGMQLVTKDKDDTPVLSIYNDRNASMFTQILGIVTDPTTTFRLEQINTSDGVDIYQQGSNMFMNDQILFRLTAMFRVIEARKMESDFGVLPLPKYDEEQKDYYHLLSYAAPTISIPITAVDPENNAAVIDALSYYGREIVLPEYYGRVLQGQVTRDEESQEMLDIIFDSAYFDLGVIHNFGGLRSIFGAMTAEESDTFASKYSASETSANKQLTRIIRQYQTQD